jgi:hypothetical protein
LIFSALKRTLNPSALESLHSASLFSIQTYLLVGLKVEPHPDGLQPPDTRQIFQIQILDIAVKASLVLEKFNVLSNRFTFFIIKP